MFVFFRFLILFFLLEVALLYMIFIWECFRFIFMYWTVIEEEEDLARRRILKELSILANKRTDYINLRIFIVDFFFFSFFFNIFLFCD